MIYEMRSINDPELCSAQWPSFCVRLECYFSAGRHLIRTPEVKDRHSRADRNLNEASQKARSPPRGENYAAEFMFVHSTGLVDDRKEHIDGTLSMDTIPTLPPPSFDAPAETSRLRRRCGFQRAGRESSSGGRCGTLQFTRRRTGAGRSSKCRARYYRRNERRSN